MAPKRGAAASKAAKAKQATPTRASTRKTNATVAKKTAAGKASKAPPVAAKTKARPREPRASAKASKASSASSTTKRNRDDDSEDEPSTTKRRKVAAPEPKAKAGRKPPAAKKAKQPKPKVVLNTAATKQLDVYVCGSGDFGELGLGSVKHATEAKAPRHNPNLTGVVQVALGGMHGIALTHDNEILTWGVNDKGTLGRKTHWEGKMKDMDAEEDEDDDSDAGADLNPLESTPTAIDASAFPEGTVFTQVAAGDSTSFALTDTGLVYGWGIFRNSSGPFGFNVIEDPKHKTSSKKPILIPDGDNPQTEPKLIEGLKNILQIAVGDNHALALDKSGRVFAWGSGEQSQLARKLMDRHIHQALLPAPVALPKSIVSISAGADHSFAVDNTGKLYSWGLNNFAQCGVTPGADDANSIITKPILIQSLLDRPVKTAVGGNHHSIALTDSGDSIVWGRLDGCQIGIKKDSLPLEDEEQILKSDTGRPSGLIQPTKNTNVPTATYIATGSDHTIAITEDGKAYSWGFNSSYQCGRSPDDDIEVATLIEGRQVKEKALVWAGAGGQFSAFAAEAMPN